MPYHEYENSRRGSPGSSWAGLGSPAKAEVLAKDLTLMERKRLELARALATRPKLLLLDELMAGLNQVEAEEAMRLIRQLTQNHDLTILMVEHIVKAICRALRSHRGAEHGEKIAEGYHRKLSTIPK